MSKLSRALVALSFAGLAPGVYAATSDTVILSGTVESSLSIVASPTANASNLDLSEGEKIVHVADLAMSTNNEQGFTLTATSGDLSKAGGTPIPFQVTTVDDSAAAPLSGDFSVASGANYTFSTVVAGSFDQDLYIKYTPAALQDPGTYSGTINLTVSDN